MNRNYFRNSALQFLGVLAWFLFHPSPAIANHELKPDKYTCPFSPTQNQDTREKAISDFAFQLVDQGSAQKNSLCQKYMGTLNSARDAYTAVLRGQAVADSASVANGTLTADQANTQKLNAQIQMSNSLQGFMSSGCQTANQSEVATMALNIMDSISASLTVAGFFNPTALVAGVGLSAVSRLGVALASWLFPAPETARERLQTTMTNNSFLDQLCTFRNLAYHMDEVDGSSVNWKVEQNKARRDYYSSMIKIYENPWAACYLRTEESQSEVEKMASDLQNILNSSSSKSASDQCARLTYALEEESPTTHQGIYNRLFDLGWRLGCFDDDQASNNVFVSRRVRDFCRQINGMISQSENVDCFGNNKEAIDKFVATTRFVFENAATAGQAHLHDLKENNPDLYSVYKDLKNQSDLLASHMEILDHINGGNSAGLVQTQSLVTNLGNIMLGEGLKNYYAWNTKEIQRNIENSNEKAEIISDGDASAQEKCAAAQYIFQRIQQIGPRVEAMKKICMTLYSDGTGPNPPFQDKTKTFDSIVDLKEPPVATICTKKEDMDVDGEVRRLQLVSQAGLAQCQNNKK